VFRGDSLEIDGDNPYGDPLSVDSIKNIHIRGIGKCKIIGPDENMNIYNPHTEFVVGDFYDWRTCQIFFACF